jgi:hypothetical protein
MTWQRTYSDEQLTTAMATATSWRGVLRALGLVATSSGAMRSVRARADHLSIDYSHFRGQRRWSDDDLRDGVTGAHSWLDVFDRLGAVGVSAQTTVRGHAARLGLDVRQLTPVTFTSADSDQVPTTANLDRAGSLLAAAWFALCGFNVSWPLEPCRYDLLVSRESRIRRVQVKTTTVRAGGTWKVYLSVSGHDRRPYDPSEIDDFFIIDGELNHYIIPVATVGGLHAIHLSGYDQFRVEKLA